LSVGTCRGADNCRGSPLGWHERSNSQGLGSFVGALFGAHYLNGVERAEGHVSIDNIARIAKGLRFQRLELLVHSFKVVAQPHTAHAGSGYPSAEDVLRGVGGGEDISI
jgi:hypothetical protein